MDPACNALLAAYPDRFTPASATVWVGDRRDRLRERAGPRTDHNVAVSSGCAASGAHSHVRVVAAEATHALRRLDAGLGPVCERCAAVLAFDRLEGAPAVVRCAGCTAPSTADTRWCR